MMKKAIRVKTKSRHSVLRASVLLPMLSILMLVAMFVGMPRNANGGQISSHVSRGAKQGTIFAASKLQNATGRSGPASGSMIFKLASKTGGAGGDSSERSVNSPMENSVSAGQNTNGSAEGGSSASNKGDSSASDGASSSDSSDSSNAGSTNSKSSGSANGAFSDQGGSASEVANEQTTNKGATLEKKLKSVDGHTYVVRVTYDGQANVPAGAELSVTELNQYPNDWNDEEKQQTDYKDRPTATERLLTSEEMTAQVADLTRVLELGKDGHLVWNKLLNVAIMANGEEVVPATNCKVEVELDTLSANASDSLEAAIVKGSESIRLEIQNTTDTKEGEADKKSEELKTRIEFQTSRLGELGLAQVVEKKFGWTMHGSEVSVFGARSVGTTPYEVPLNMEYGNGLRLIDVFGISVVPTHSFETALWISAKKTTSSDNEFSGVRGYRMQGDNTAVELFGANGTKGMVSFPSNNLVALVWDSGYRSTVIQTGDVMLAGEMPIGTSATINDVTPQYEDVKTLNEELSADNAKTVAAYDVSLMANNAEWDPNAKHPVRMQVSNDEIDASKKTEEYAVLHVAEDGTASEVASRTDDGTVAFNATSDGTYVVVRYTVDFHWGDLVYSIAGQSDILLSELLGKLGINDFSAADVANVSFSNESLVKVQQVKDDWKLTSLKAFSSEETLKLTLKNGAVVNIRVTDAPDDLEGTITITANSNTRAYNGEELTDGGYTTTGKLFEGDSIQSVTVEGTQKDVGKHDNVPSAAKIVDASGEDVTSKYTITYKNGTLEVTPAQVTVKANDASKTYGEADPELTATVTGLIGEDTIAYGLEREAGGDADKYDIIPSGEEKQGNYEVTYVNGVFTINPKPVEVKITGHNNTTTYDGTEHTVSGYDVTIEDAQYKENDFSFTGDDSASRTNAGTTQMNLSADKFENNNTNYAPTFVVTDGYQKIDPYSNEVKVTVVGNNETEEYDGTEQTVEGYAATTDNTLYSIDDNVMFSGNAEIKRTDAGTTNMELKAEQFHNISENFSNVTFDITDGYLTISPLKNVVVTITGENDTWDYDGTEHKVMGYDVSFEGDRGLYDEDYINFTGTAEAKGTNAGTTYMGLKPEQFSNTSANFEDVTFNVTDGYLTIEPIEVTVTIVGNNHTCSYDGQSHTAEGYTATADTNLYKVAGEEKDFEFSGEAKAAGTDVNTYKMNLSPNQFVNKSVNFKDVVFEIEEDGYLTIEPIDADVQIIGHTGTFTYDGTEHKVEGYDVVIEQGSLYKPEYIRFIGTDSVSRTEAGMADMNLSAELFENTSPNFKNVTFEVTDGWITVNPKVTISKTLDNVLAIIPEKFDFVLRLTDTNGQPVEGWLLAGDNALTGTVTDSAGAARLSISVAGGQTDSEDIAIPLESTLTITEDKSHDTNNYKTTVRIDGGESEDVAEAMLESVSSSHSTVAFTNAKTPICRIDEHKFQTIASAVEWARHNEPDATIYMLVDYVMPTTDQVLIPSGCSITLATAPEYEGEMATIKRIAGYTGTMLTNHGTLNIGDGSAGIAIDGNGGVVEANGPMIENDGTLSIASYAKLQNANSTGNGGAIASTGTVNVDGGTISQNSASKGGAIYATDGNVNVRGGSINSNSATNGGAIYTTIAVVDITGGTIGSNSVIGGNGGAICAETGTVSVRGGALSGNTASATLTGTFGLGGAIYSGQGGVNVAGGTIGGTIANRAENGSAIYVGSGSATFTGGNIVGNVATKSDDWGGAIGIGSENATLSFSETPVITGNTNEAGNARNVCLSIDSALIINANGLEDGSSVGIYVPGDGDLYEHRGVSKARFGRYTSNAGISGFSNDRTPGMTVSEDNSWLQWGKGIVVETRYLQTFSSTSLPPTTVGVVKQTIDNYFPSSTSNYVSDIAAEIGVDVANAAFACAFADGDTMYSQNLSMVNWDATAGTWKFVRRDGTGTTTVDKLIIYYSYPEYIYVANNTDYQFSAASLTANGVSSLNQGYGFVVARNGATVEHFVPISASDLNLAPNQNVKIMLPGVRYQTYVLNGGFEGVTGSNTIDYRYDTTNNGTARITNSGTLDAGQAASFSVTGKLFNNSKDTINVEFGEATKICKIVDKNGVEHTFSSIAAAVTEGEAHYNDWIDEATGSVKIEMLQDYLITGNDQPNIPAGKKYTITTAISGKTRGNLVYTPSDPSETNPRAQISRDQGNEYSFITSRTGGTGTELQIKDLVFDGKQVAASKVDGGVLNTKDTKVTIDNVKVVNFTANNGGALYIDYSNNTLANKYLEVTNSDFENCVSLSNTDKFGGGAIWSNAEHLTLSGDTFKYCNATQQGGALFHRIDDNYVYDDTSTTTIDGGCKFEHCYANAGGGLEIESLNAHVSNSEFTDCQAKTRNGGAFNAYLRDPKAGGQLTVTNCSFTDCFANQNGGAFRTLYQTTVIGSTFTNNTANTNGGGVAATDNSTIILDSCTVTGNKSGGLGGGVYSVGNITLRNGTTITGNSLTHNTKESAGGVYYGGNKNLTIGPANASDPIGTKDTIIIKDNTTLDGSPSNLRLPGNPNNNTVRAAGSLSETSEIYVINAGNVGTQFGEVTSGIQDPAGYSTMAHAFRDDYNELYGGLKRGDTSKIVWRGEPIAKITDGDNNLLFFDTQGTDAAIFDYLDNGSNNAGKGGAFEYLKNSQANIKLYQKDGTPYTGTTFKVKMLIDEYTLGKYITVSKQAGRTIELTKADKSDSDGFPYRGDADVATIYRGTGVGAGNSMIKANGNLTITNVTLDGMSNSITTTTAGPMVWLNPGDENYKLILGAGATLQNSKSTGSGNPNSRGGAIYAQTGSVELNAGSVIRNCENENGGAIFKREKGSITIDGGIIDGCKAKIGAAVYMNNANLYIKSGGITNCASTDKGGAIYFGEYDNPKPILYMSGGRIENNTAKNAGGAIVFNSSKDFNKAYFSGDAYVYNNTLTDGRKNNVELNRGNTGLINTTAEGLGENALIGVYVPDNNNLYNNYGVKGKTFGTYANNTNNLFLFVNDRNDLRGHNRGTNEIYWVEMDSLTVAKTVESELASDKSQKKFHYKVELQDTSVNGKRGSGNSAMVFTDGIAEFDLGDGEYKTALYVPTSAGGTDISGTYTVTETLDGDFNTTAKKNGQDAPNEAADPETSYTVTGSFDDVDASGKSILAHNVTYTNTRKTGNLNITKQVESTEAADAEKEFSFRVQLSYALTGTYGDVAFTNGVATFTLKGGESKNAANLPTGIQYTVTETSDSSFNTTTTVNGEDVQPVQVNMRAGANNNVVFKNTRKTGSLKVTKHVTTTREADKQVPFNFVVQLSDTSIGTEEEPKTYGDLSFVKGKAEFELKAEESKTATNLPMGITYTVQEEPVEHFTATRIRNASGRIADSPIEAEFTNTHDTGRLVIDKTVVTDRYADRNEPFTFTVSLGRTEEGQFVADESINHKYGDVTFVKGVGTLNVIGQARKTISGLPQGLEYKVTEADKVMFTLESQSGDTGTIKSSDSTAAFTNKRRTGSLTVKKQVVSDIAADVGQEFAFTIKLGDTRINKTYSGVVFEKGTGTLSLKGGEEKTIEGLPTDVTFTVSEAKNNNFNVESTGASGTINTNGSTAEFANTRKTGKLTVEKVVNKDTESSKDTEFTFTVKLSGLKNDADTKTYGGTTFTKVEGQEGVYQTTFKLKGGNSNTIEGLPYGAGYAVAEEANPNYTTAVPSKATGTINVPETSMRFTNTRKVGNLVIKKTVASDLTSDKTASYDYTVKLGKIEDGVMKPDTTINAKFGSVQFTNGVAQNVKVTGGRSLTLSKIPNGLDYEVTETKVSDMDGSPVDTDGNIRSTGTIALEKDSEAAFTNTRLTGDLKINKTVVSNLAADANQGFAFTIQLGDRKLAATYAAVDAQGKALSNVSFSKGKATVSLKGGESITIKGLPRTVNYTVSEVANSAFEITSQVGDTGTIGSTVSEASFTNKRKMGSLAVTKKVNSHQDSDKNKQFDFKVTLTGLTREAATGRYGGMNFEYKEGVGAVATFKLKDGQSLQADDLPTDVAFNVEEVLSAADASYYQTSYVLVRNGATSVGQSGTVREGLATVRTTNTANRSFIVTKEWDANVANPEQYEVDFELFKVKAKGGHSATWGQTGNVSTVPSELVRPNVSWSDFYHSDTGRTEAELDTGFIAVSSDDGTTYYYIRDNISDNQQRPINEYSQALQYTGRVLTKEDAVLNQGSAQNAKKEYWLYLTAGDLVFFEGDYYVARESHTTKLWQENGVWGIDQVSTQPNSGALVRLSTDGVGVGGGGSSTSGKVEIQYESQEAAIAEKGLLEDEEHNNTVISVPNRAAGAVQSEDGTTAYYTLSAQNNWMYEFSDELENGYSYYAVERQVRMAGSQTNIISNFLVTYDYEQDVHAVIHNATAGSARVILRKVGDSDASDSNNPLVSLSGARFKLYTKGGVEIKEGQEEGKDYYESDTTGVYFVGTLTYGTYTLVEIVSPAGYEPSGYNASDSSTWVSYELIVDENGVRISGPSNNTIDVKDPEIQYEISLSPDQDIYYADDANGNTAKASVLLKKDDGSHVEYTGTVEKWETSDKDGSVVTVDQDGTLHFVGAGTADVTATFAEGSATKKITVMQHVKKELVTKSLNGFVNGFDIVNIVYEVDGVSEFPAGSLSLEVANQSIATAAVQDGEIVVSYHGRGTTTLVVKLDGEQLGNPIPIAVDEVILNTESLTGKVGETKPIVVTWTGADGSNKTGEVASKLTYTVENPNVVSISGTTATFGATTGSTEVTVKFNGKFLDKFMVTTEPRDPLDNTDTLSIPIDGMSFSLPLGVVDSNRWNFTDEARNKIDADGGFKKGKLYVRGSEVAYCAKDWTDYNSTWGILIPLIGASYENGTVSYDNSALVDGNNLNLDHAFYAAIGSIVKQDGKYYVTVDPNNTNYFKDVTCATDSRFQLIG